MSSELAKPDFSVQNPRAFVRVQGAESVDGFEVRVEPLANDEWLVACRWAGEAESPQAEFGVEVDWAGNSYLCIPGAVYAGNRFRVNASPYPCLLDDPEDWRADVPTTISDIPRLGERPLQLRAGDAAIAAIGWCGADEGVWLQVDPVGNPMLEVEGGHVRVVAFGVRRPERYHSGPQWVPSEDRGKSFLPGEQAELRFRVVRTAGGVRGLFRVLPGLRGFYGSRTQPEALPLSEAFRLVEESYNSVHWDEEGGYYAVGDRQSDYSHWQMGWVGGGISAYALHASGGELSRERALRNLEFAVGRGLAPSGLFWSVVEPGREFGDMIDMPYGNDWHLVRRSGDGLYFLGRLAEAAGVRPDGLLRVAEALAEIWARNGQFGQFVSDRTGEIRVGGTTSGAIVPAALTIAARLFGRPDLLQVAIDSGRALADRWLGLGYTCGGPGEAAQCPDSESAFALLESLMALFEATGDPAWLPLAEDAAAQCASWVMDYDFEFPPSSTFGRLGMRTTGSVWANAQNKHSAPAICTLSGASLLKLTRATGNPAWADLLQEIARGLPQYLSREDRPVFGMPPGWMCERVNTSDWEHPEIPIGEGFPIGCWCEVSQMLTYAEVPGVWVWGDRVWCFDAVEARLERGTLHVRNLSTFPASVRVLVEPGPEVQTLSLGPGESRQLS